MKTDITKAKTIARKTISGQEEILRNTGERLWSAPAYVYYFKGDADKYGLGGWYISQSDFERLVENGELRVVEEYDEPKEWGKGKIWEAIEADGYEKYDAFVSLIKDALCPLNPEENEKAYFIEDVVNGILGDMFDQLEHRF